MASFCQKQSNGRKNGESKKWDVLHKRETGANMSRRAVMANLQSLPNSARMNA